MRNRESGLFISCSGPDCALVFHCAFSSVVGVFQLWFLLIPLQLFMSPFPIYALLTDAAKASYLWYSPWGSDVKASNWAASFRIRVPFGSPVFKCFFIELLFILCDKLQTGIVLLFGMLGVVGGHARLPCWRLPSCLAQKDKRRYACGAKGAIGLPLSVMRIPCHSCGKKWEVCMRVSDQLHAVGSLGILLCRYVWLLPVNGGLVPCYSETSLVQKPQHFGHWTL